MTLRHLIESLLSENAELRRQLFWLGVSGSVDASNAARAALDTLPDWHDKPTMPGMWFTIDRTMDAGWVNVTEVSDTAWDTYNAVMNILRVYGPIPSPQETTT